MSEPTLAIASLGLGAAGLGVNVLGGLAESRAASAQATYLSQVARNNQILAQRAAEDARARGEKEANIKRREAKQLTARQTAALAGAGIDVAGEAAVELRAATAAVFEEDALTIASNAEREALGFEARGMGFASEASLFTAQAGSSGFLKAGASLLTGAGSVASKWYAFKHEGVF